MPLIVIDELLRRQYSWLGADDKCYALREYTARQGYQYSETNQLILNFKMGVEIRDKPMRFRHKGKAIKQVANEFKDALNPKWLDQALLVPVPPSKSRDNPLYDDRVLQMLKLLASPGHDVRDLLRQTVDMDPSHSGSRASPDSLRQVYQLDTALLEPRPDCIGLFDDVLATGSHFVAAKTALQAYYGSEMQVFGMFIARNVHVDVDEDWPDFDKEQ